MTKLDDIKVPSNLNEITKNTIKKGKNIKRRKKMRNLKIASMIVLAMSTGLTIINTSLANEIPIINDLFKGPVNNKYSNYTQGINLTKTIGAVSLTINEIVCDGNQLNFTYTIKSKTKLPRQTKDVFYQDKLILDTDIKSTTYASEVIGGYIDDYTYQGKQSYNLVFEGFKRPKTIKLNLSINNIYVYENNSEEILDSIKGPFNFKLEINPNVETKIIDVKELKNGFTVDSLEITPQSLKVNVSFPKKFLLNNDAKEPYISLATGYASNIAGKTYSIDDIKHRNYYSRMGMVYDSFVVDNHYTIGSYSDEYIVVKFEDFNNKSDNLTEFKIYLDK